MKIVTVTAGTGSFYCGTCMRDNALTRELRRLGHDAMLVPLYLPPMLDEDSTLGETPLFYGGINVYLQQKLGLFRHLPRGLVSWLDSPGLLRKAAARAGMTSPKDLAEVTLSVLQGEEGNQRRELDRLADWLTAEKPDVILLSNGLLIGLAHSLAERTRARVFCFLQGEDTYLDSLPNGDRERAWKAFRDRCADVEGFLSVSHYFTALMVERLKLDPGRVQTIYPGIELEGYREPSPPELPTIGYLARMCKAKGVDRLVSAFIQLHCRGSVPNVRLRVAGSCTAADERFVQELKLQLEEAGLARQVEWRPNLSREEKLAARHGVSVFCVPATYGESFGLYVLEAMAAGLPVVLPRHAAFPEILAETGGGVLYSPEDEGEMVDQLESLLRDPTRAAELGVKGRLAVQARFTVPAMAQATLAAIS